ncbi:hypothetical protein ACIPW9_36455 [Streptomyces sp. NPDC090052]|uniref:hypothetical protein n=1 Tax=Streptomyces sp. NPDC090052 TaxID=3365931 RepID=UPI003808CBAC
MTGKIVEEQLTHWHDELARVLHANQHLHWPDLIEWAAEANEWALKAATRSGRERLSGLEQRAKEAEGALKAKTAELKRVRKELAASQEAVFALTDMVETAAYDRAWPADRERPADVAREVEKAVTTEREKTRAVEDQFREAAERWRAQRALLEKAVRDEA